MKLGELKGNMGNFIIIVVNFHTTISAINRTFRQKSIKDLSYQQPLPNKYHRILYTTAGYIFFTHIHGAFTKLIICQTINRSQIKKMQIKFF